jgi:two-component system response regulator DevR
MGSSVDGVSSTPIRIFVLDDHEVVRVGLVELLEAAGDMVVVGEAATAAQALRRIPAVLPDIALLDARLPDGSGIDVCREIRSRYPQVHCLILTSFDDDEALLSAVMAGASGYLLKEIVGSRLKEDIRHVARGRSLLDPALTQQLIERLGQPRPEDPATAGLTPREKEILDLITDGLTNRQIGEQLFLAEKTVKNCVSAIFHKLGLERRTQAAVVGAEVRARAQQP